MSKLRSALQTKDSFTQNGAVTHSTSGSYCLDFFATAGGMRGKDPLPLFYRALEEDVEITIRLLLWLRDIRGGAGERELFRKVFYSLCTSHPDIATMIIPKVPFIGRWDDLLSFSVEVQDACIEYIAEALHNGDALCAKWMPREKSSKGILGYAIRKAMGLSSREYRKLLSGLSRTVEQDMSAHRWNSIKYSHVPSQAMKKYTKAFYKHDKDRFAQYIEDVKNGKVKINASTIHPHELLGKYLTAYGVSPLLVHDKTINNAIEAQWYALPNYVEEKHSSAICVCDTSGSMAGLPIRVAVALSIYFAERTTGPFKNEFITFSKQPQLQVLTGKTLQQKVHNLIKANWDMNTDLDAVFELILKKAKSHKLSNEDLPKSIIIISDMEFDKCTQKNKRTNYEQMHKRYSEAGYDVPHVIFWNVSSISSNNIPVKMHESGATLISGFSPSILKHVMSGEQLTPFVTMINTIMNDRYTWRDGFPGEVTSYLP